MKYAEGDYFVFLDDYHIFPNNFLAEHFKICEQGFAGIVNWNITKYEGRIDYSMANPTIIKKDSRMGYFLDHKNEYDKYGNWFVGVPWDWWWPNSASVPAKYILEIDGFNELYCGGIGGEDSDVAYRMYTIGLKFAYNPNITVYHIQHNALNRTKAELNGTKKDLIPMRSLPHQDNMHECHYFHDRRSFTKNEHYKHGNPDLIENEQLLTWFQNGYKVFQCKYCGEYGAIDGQQMLANTKHRCEQQIYRSPEEINFPDGTTHICTKLKEK